MDMTDSDNPHTVDIKKLASSQLKIDLKTAVVQKSDGTVYFTGGFDEGRNRSHNCLYVYDPLQGSMSQMADLITARSSHGICVNGKFIYVVGGRNDTNLPIKSFERFDSSINVWEKLPDCQVPAIRPLLVTLNDKFIFKIGGIGTDDNPCNVIERFDITRNEWTSVDYRTREDNQTLKRMGFALHPMMSGVQINYNSIFVGSLY